MTPSLTPKQAVVARLLAEGLSYAEVGHRLGIGYSAVLTRVRSAIKLWPEPQRKNPKEKLKAWAGGREG